MVKAGFQVTQWPFDRDDPERAIFRGPGSEGRANAYAKWLSEGGDPAMVTREWEESDLGVGKGGGKGER